MTFALGFANSSAIRWSLVSASSPLLWASARMPECPGFRFRGCGGHAGHHSRRHRLRARSIAAAAPGHASGRPQGDGLGVCEAGGYEAPLWSAEWPGAALVVRRRLNAPQLPVSESRESGISDRAFADHENCASWGHLSMVRTNTRLSRT